MEKYIGTKEVKAEKCTLGTFIAETGRDPYKGSSVEHKDEEPGYKVQYKDGYISWSPKETFEEAYSLFETEADRVCNEGVRLNDKLVELETFLHTKEFKAFDEKRRAMIHVQKACMERYLDILTKMYWGLVSDEWNLDGLTYGEAINLLEAGFAVCREGWNDKSMFIVKQIPCTISEKIIPNIQSLPQSAKDILMSRSNKEIHYNNQILIVKQDSTADSWVPSASDIFAKDWKIFVR